MHFVADEIYRMTLPAQRIFGSSFSYTSTTNSSELLVVDPDGIQL